MNLLDKIVAALETGWIHGEFKKAFQLLNQGKDINYEGAAGSVDFDKNGDVKTPIEIWRYLKGDMVTVRIELVIPRI